MFDATMYDAIVVGNGLIGSAATRYLSAAGLNVAGIGPGEPANWQTHQGVFASHYDQGRITRIIDPDSVWGLLGKRSLEAYAALEAQSGVNFHYAVGGLRVSADPTNPNDSLGRAENVGRELGAVYVQQTRDDLHTHFPFLSFPAGTVALWETGQAGYINPRSLAQAQLTAAAQQGAQVIRETVRAYTCDNGVYTVTTDAGQQYSAPKLLLATGAYTNHLLPRPLDLHPRCATITLAAIDEAEAARLQAMPTLIYRLLSHPQLYSIYVLPPVRYPDGKMYIKLGGTFFHHSYLHEPAEFLQWFHGAGDQVQGAALQEVLCELIPNLQATSFQTRPCVVTYTAHDHPYVEQIEEGLFLAVGGCGAAAKSSNEIGRMAALLVEHGAWRYDVDASVFAAQFRQ
ncbi:MAG: FAD-binding oxidoreductase [Caldilineaceae bacterium]|nr:FAD-binding oxidoreductase [Caldilineaceae bacterium]